MAGRIATPQLSLPVVEGLSSGMKWNRIGAKSVFPGVPGERYPRFLTGKSRPGRCLSTRLLAVTEIGFRFANPE
jgi:hypothetical protein